MSSPPSGGWGASSIYMDISIIIPLYNEEESLPALFEWIERVMIENKFSFEVIFVNDGSTDNSWSVIESLKEKSSSVHGIKFRHNYGKSPALYCGFNAAKGNDAKTPENQSMKKPDYRLAENFCLANGNFHH